MHFWSMCLFPTSSFADILYTDVTYKLVCYGVRSFKQNIEGVMSS